MKKQESATQAATSEREMTELTNSRYLSRLAALYCSQVLQVPVMAEAAAASPSLSEIVGTLDAEIPWTAQAFRILAEAWSVSPPSRSKQPRRLARFAAEHDRKRWDISMVLEEEISLVDSPFLREISRSGQDLRRVMRHETAPVQDNVLAFGKMLGLTALERDVLMFVVTLEGNKALKEAALVTPYLGKDELVQWIAAFLGKPKADVDSALSATGTLISSGVLRIKMAPDDLANKIECAASVCDILLQRHADTAAMELRFLDSLGETELDRDRYPHLAQPVEILRAMLRSAASGREKGVNVLLYGPPGTGKTELARVLAKDLGFDAFEVRSAGRTGQSLSGRDRVAQFNVMQRLLCRNRRSLVVFDEIEDVFPPTESAQFIVSDSDSGVVGKAWMNKILESNPVPAIWISNNIEQIDPAYLRRFGFHLEVTIPPRSVRRDIAARSLESLGVRPETIDLVAGWDLVSPGALATASRTVRLACRSGGDPDSTLTTTLRNGLAIGGNPEPGGRLDTTRTDLDLLNVEGSIPITELLQAIGSETATTLLLYGPPGTGKTTLAEALARQVDRPLLTYRASDLQSKYVGETEKNIAAMFRRAQVERAVLFIDEADSFLSPREEAGKAWEVSQVNELLQQMERFRGIFLCATNLLDRIDAAAFRRFMFKIKFKPLRAEQRLRLFEEACGSISPRSEAARAVSALDQLTLGDFAVVRRQADLLKRAFTPDTLAAALREECKVKQGGLSRPIGFV